MEAYEQHIDFIYTTLLMVWGGSCIGVGVIVVPFLFKHLNSTDEASELTSRIFKRLDLVVRVIVICLIAVFYFKSKLTYSYQHIEWVVYVLAAHCFIFGKFVTKRLWTLMAQIPSFNGPEDRDPLRGKFRKWHRIAELLFSGQIIAVIALLYLHAFGLK